MKNRYAIFLLFFCIFSAIDAAGDGQPNTTYNYGPASPNQSPTFINNIFIGITQEMATNIQNSISNTFQALYQVTNEACQKGKESLDNVKDWILSNKLKLSFYGVVSLYAYVHYKLFTLRYQLLQPENWSLWNNSVTLDELHGMTEKELGDMLIKEAQQRYTLIDDPENFIIPMITFLQTVEVEKHLLQNYILLCGWIHTTHAEKIFLMDENVASIYEERLKRLAYLRAIFVNWITEYKLQQHTAPAAA